MEKSAKARSLEVVTFERYAIGTMDHAAAITQMRAANPDWVFATGYINDLILIRKQMNDLGLRPQVVTMIAGPPTRNSPRPVGPLAENVSSAAWWHPAVRYNGKDVFGSTEDFNAAWAKKYKGEADYAEASAAAAGAILQLAIEKPRIRSIPPRCATRSRRSIPRHSSAASSSAQTGQINSLEPPVFQIQGGKPVVIYPARHQAGRLQVHRRPDLGAARGPGRHGGPSVMIYLQIAANGLVLGGLYACIAVGFSLVWGVLNVINILHGTFIVLGSYVAFFAYIHVGHSSVPVGRHRRRAAVRARLRGAGGLINRVIAAPVLITLTLTFGLDLVLNNAMLVAFTADYRKINLVRRSVDRDRSGVPAGDRVAAMALAVLLTLLLYRLLRDSRIGRAIVAVRMDREAAALMGVDVKRINAITFGIGAFMAGAAGALLSIIFPDLAAQQLAVSRQGLRGLRARRARQRAGRDGRRARARDHRELRLVLVRSRTRGDAVVRAAAAAVRASERPPRAGGATNEEWIVLAVGAVLLAALPLTGNNYLLRLATICACMRCLRSPGISSAGLPAIRPSQPPPSSASAPMRRRYARSKACR